MNEWITHEGKNEGQLIILQREEEKKTSLGRYAGIIHYEPDSA